MLTAALIIAVGFVAWRVVCAGKEFDEIRSGEWKKHMKGVG